jgi:hypothetical protein
VCSIHCICNAPWLFEIATELVKYVADERERYANQLQFTSIFKGGLERWRSLLFSQPHQAFILLQQTQKKSGEIDVAGSGL